MSARDHPELFLTDLVSDPAGVIARAAQLGIRNKSVAELAAWSWELGMQVHETATRFGIPLLLMGGTAAQLRFRVEVQRGSRDADFLTTASREQVAQLAASLETNLGQAGERDPIFRVRLYQPRRTTRDLDMLRYDVTVPSLIGQPPPTIKLEFHFWDALPPNEPLTGHVFPFAAEVRQQVPVIAYQIGLKLRTVALPPIGIEPHREDELPKQFYDLDWLFAVMRPDELEAVGAAAPQVAVYEGGETDGADLWPGIEHRLYAWASGMSSDANMQRRIDQYQQQVPAAARLTAGGWRVRLRRLAVAARCAETGDVERWTAAIALARQLSRARDRTPIETRWEQERGSLPARDLQALNPEGLWWEYLATGGSHMPLARSRRTSSRGGG